MVAGEEIFSTSARLLLLENCGSRAALCRTRIAAHVFVISADKISGEYIFWQFQKVIKPSVLQKGNQPCLSCVRTNARTHTRAHALYQHFQVNKLYLVLEYCKKGDLMNILNGDTRTVECDPMNDDDVCYIMRQVCSATNIACCRRDPRKVYLLLRRSAVSETNENTKGIARGGGGGRGGVPVCFGAVRS